VSGDLSGGATPAYRAPDWNTLPDTLHTYDPLGRPSTSTGPGGDITRRYYSLGSDGGAARQRTANIDPNHHLTISEHDPFGRLTKARQYSGSYPGNPDWAATPYATASYGYDVADRLLWAADPLGNTTSLSYDPFGRKAHLYDPDMGHWAYLYDPAGNLTRQTDARGQGVCFYYDPLDRLTGKHYTTAPCPANPTLNASYGYDAGANGIGRRTSMSVPGVDSTAWTYDVRGRVASQSKTIAGATYTTGWTYDSLDRPLSLTYPQTGETVVHSYDAGGGLAKLHSNPYNLDYAGGLKYNALGGLAEVSYGNGVRQRLGYWGLGGTWDSLPSAGLVGFGRLYESRLQAPGGAALLALRYDYDGTGNLLKLAEPPTNGTSWPASGFSFVEEFDSTNANWAWTAEQTIVNEGGNNLLKSAGNGLNWNPQCYRAAYALGNNQGLQLRFRWTGPARGRCLPSRRTAAPTPASASPPMGASCRRS
jgi:YD repeat-containing protein